MPRRSTALVALALLLAALALLPLRLPWTRPTRVAVLVDLSASTRGTPWRDLDAITRVARAAFDDPRVVPFDAPPDWPADADAYVLLSDGRAALPAPPAPVFAVVQPDALADDAAVVDVQRLPAGARVVARNARAVSVDGRPHPLAPGDAAVVVDAAPDRAVTARVASADPWPENDALTLPPAATREQTKLWHSPRPAPEGWTTVATLPADLGAYQNVAAVVAERAGAPAALGRYVRELGGTLVLAGADGAFGAPGGWAGTDLDALAPLAADPPPGDARTLVLIDRSGSTARGGVADFIVDAARAAVRALPAGRVELAAFARDVTAIESLDVLPRPNGPTNLAAALRFARERGATRVLLFTDADATVPADFAFDARLDVFAPAPPRDDALRRLAERTGGALVAADAPARWAEAVEAWATAARAPRVRVTPAEAAWDGRTLRFERWVETWPRADARASVGGGDLGPAVAHADRGAGQVLAVGGVVPEADLAALADALARPAASASVVFARDSITVDAEAERVEVRVEGVAHALTRVAPGRFEAALPRGSDERVAEVWADGALARRVTLPGRYAAEFDQIGVDADALRALAESSGGATVARLEDARPAGRRTRVDLRPALLALAALAAGAALVAGRRGV